MVAEAVATGEAEDRGAINAFVAIPPIALAARYVPLAPRRTTPTAIPTAVRVMFNGLSREPISRCCPRRAALKRVVRDRTAGFRRARGGKRSCMPGHPRASR